MANEKRLIYLEDAYEAVTDLSGQAETKSAYAAFWKAGKELEKLPTVDAAPVVHGRWEPELMPAGVEYVGWEEMTVQALRCSECMNFIDVSEGHFSYCPNCGAKMDGGSDNE